MILLDKAHQYVHKEEGFFPQRSRQVSYLSKTSMQAHQKSVEAYISDFQEE
jgi:hypothetical protein